MKTLTFCINCGVVNEFEGNLFQDSIHIEKEEGCCNCKCRHFDIVECYEEEPEYFVSDIGEWSEGRFEQFFCERTMNWHYLQGHFRNDDSRNGIYRRKIDVKHEE